MHLRDEKLDRRKPNGRNNYIVIDELGENEQV